MKPTLSFSAAEAPNRLAPAVRITAVAATRIFLINFSDFPGVVCISRCALPIARFGHAYRSGTNTVPSAAGAVETPVRAREIRTRTMTVARYANADMNWGGRPKHTP